MSARHDWWLGAIAAVLVNLIIFRALVSVSLKNEKFEAEVPVTRLMFIEREVPGKPSTPEFGAESVVAPTSKRTQSVQARIYSRVPTPKRDGLGAAGHGGAQPLNLDLTDLHSPDFSRQVLKGDTRLDRFAAPTERIPMRKPLTGKDVIEGASQILGFWPPGYTTDPCPRIRRNIDELKTDGSASGRERLAQEMARQARYCP